MSEVLLVGVAEIDITPPVGTLLAGSLVPRTSTGVGNPLCAKAIVLASGGVRLAYVALDLISLDRGFGGDRAVELASRASGIPTDHICYSCSHTHTGPYTRKRQADLMDENWFATLPERIAEAVRLADETKVPARMSRCRAFEMRTHQNRRIRFKDGRHINAWLLGNHVNGDLQSVGTAGPVDPEVGMLAFDALDGRLLAVMYHFTLHANSDFGPMFSADYPGIVSQRMREEFGKEVMSLFMPGCCGDVNPTHSRDHLTTGDLLADQMIPALRKREPIVGPIRLGARKRTVDVPLRDLELDQEERLDKCGWGKTSNKYFRKAQAALREEGLTQVETLVQAFHIGDIGFVTLPGEVFVDWQLKIKESSPFPWTYPVELSNDSLGYLITRDAWEGGGYEALTSRGTFIDVAGVELMVDRVTEMLRQLSRVQSQER
jgi:neutral ceramidase